MFNWTTTTIINSLEDYKTGSPLVKVWESAEDGEGGLKAGFSGEYPILKIKRDHTFEKRYISTVYKAYANNPVFCELQIDAAAVVTAVRALAEGNETLVARLAFYIGLEGSEESIYANDWYQKGKPFSVGFEVTAADTGETLAKKIKKQAEKYGVVTYGKKVFELLIDEDDATKLTLKGTHEYQRIKFAAVAVDDMIDEIIVDSYKDGEEPEDTSAFSLIQRGRNGFGTYSQLVKDLRLPTAHHNKWLQLKEDEKPVVGAKYNQYIITYCAPSMANPGFTVVGQHNMSVTTHVFWVNQDVDEDFHDFIAAVASIAEVNAVETTDGVDEVSYTTDGVKEEGGKDYAANHEQKIVDTAAAEETAEP